MNIIFNKTTQSFINDSEIIQEIESAKKIPGFDINLGCSETDWSLLMVAVNYGRKDLVEYILLMYPNININQRSIYNFTVMHCCDNVSILKLLLDHKDLDVNIQNGWGWTGLFEFCYQGHKKCVRELLLDARVNTLIRDNEGRTARDDALEQGYPGIAKIMANSGYTSLLRIPNRTLLHDIVRMIIEEYT